MLTQESRSTAPKSYLPRINSRGYHFLLAAVAILILGPLGGISAAYMNFSLGFFIGGQVLAGILGSVVTYGYGAEGKHGANYMQTMAASVSTMSGMGVLIQAMVWLKLPEPPTWQLILFFACIGMFGVGVGMLYTPILVDRMQLAFPSGFAVANILRALTDKTLLKQSVAKLGSGALGGFLGGLASMKVPSIESIGISTSTIGAGMVVGSRIAIPGLVVGIIGYYMTPWFRAIGWLDQNAPFRKIGFIIALGTILGAALVDLAIIISQAIKRFKEKAKAPPLESEDWKKTNTGLLVVWVVFWGTALTIVASQLLHQPVSFVIFAIALVFIFLLINGISQGISDQNPISSAFVVAVLLMALLGLKDAGVGLMCAAILLITCAVGVDMQQDRSTGWRLGTNRIIQFRYQVIGILMGAVLAVVLSRVFMNSYPVLRQNAYLNPEAGGKQWQSAMTFKFVGALEGLTNPKPFVIKALLIGIAIGLATELIRKFLKNNRAYTRFATATPTGKATDFILDAFLIPSPYASSFGGFVELPTTVWFAVGGVITSIFDSLKHLARKEETHPAEGEVPADMSTMSLIGGGLIAGDSLAALSIGVSGLLRQLF